MLKIRHGLSERPWSSCPVQQSMREIWLHLFVPGLTVCELQNCQSLNSWAVLPSKLFWYSLQNCQSLNSWAVLPSKLFWYSLCCLRFRWSLPDLFIISDFPRRLFRIRVKSQRLVNLWWQVFSLISHAALCHLLYGKSVIFVQNAFFPSLPGHVLRSLALYELDMAMCVESTKLATIVRL